MNKRKWDSLPADVQKAIEAVNAEWIDKTGNAWDEMDKTGTSFATGLGDTIIPLSAQEDARWAQAVQPLLDEYVKEKSAKGLPAAEALKFASESPERAAVRPPPMKRSLDAVKTASSALTAVAGVALVLLMLLTIADVVLRLLGRPIPGTYELVALAGALAIGLAIPLTSWMRGHIYVDSFLSRLPRPVWARAPHRDEAPGGGRCSCSPAGTS